jgi:hypothetical protein
MPVPNYEWKPKDILRWTEYYIKGRYIKPSVKEIMAEHYVIFFNIIRTLCKEILEQPSLGDKAELESLHQEMSVCKSENERLRSELSQYKNENTELKKNLDDPFFLLTWFRKHFSSSDKKLQTKQGEIDSLNKVLAVVKQQHKELEDKFENLNVKFQKLLGEQAAKNMDRGASVRILSDNRPEDYQMAKKYENFCSKGPLATVSDDIFSYKVRIKPSIKENYPLHTAQIISSLSDNILMKSFSVLTSSATAKIGDDNFFEMPCDKFATLKDKIYKDIDIPPASANENASKLLQQIETTAKKGFNLVKDIINIVPQAELFKAEKVQEFNDELHKNSLGSKKEGVIEFTVIPGLRSGDYVFVKPVVYSIKFYPPMIV